jgi:hypothetical protein
MQINATSAVAENRQTCPLSAMAGRAPFVHWKIFRIIITPSPLAKRSNKQSDTRQTMLTPLS